MFTEKKIRPETIIQFGEGGFLRGFADWMIQKADDCGKMNAGVVVVQPIEKGMCDMLTAQNCNYTHIIRGTQGVEKTVIDVITRCVKPYEDYNAFLALAANPETKFVISNTTEAGISFDENDKLSDAPPKSFPGKVTALLYERFKTGLPGFIFIPCELIDKNGERLKEIILKYAQLWQLGDDFRNYVEAENHFCSSLVDRINTGYPKDDMPDLGYKDNLINTSEYFHLWVIEGDKKLEAELPLREAGLNVIWTDNLEPYRTRKVRILNGAHTALVPYAMLRGFKTVKECVDDGEMLAYLKNCIYNEIIPTLDLPEKELKEYADNVLERFANPYIKHYLSSIALNSFSKFKVRVMPSIIEYKKRFGKYPETLMKAFDAFYEFYKTDMANDTPEAIELVRSSSKEEVWKKLCE
ncbi:MAG: tagaturonate reductase [Clostridia bacterium]|nr:tagaturonate reductase [Clostridia bacterium]